MDKISKLKELVELQADDELLWSFSLTANEQSFFEGYIQQELRRLHKAIEAEDISEIEDLIEQYKKKVNEINDV